MPSVPEKPLIQLELWRLPAGRKPSTQPLVLLVTCFPGAQMVENLPAVQATRVQSLGRDNPLEEEMATHFTISCLENPKDRGAWRATVHGDTKSWTRLSS